MGRAGQPTSGDVMLRIRDWVAPVLTILVPIAAAFAHLELSVARLESAQAAMSQRLDRIERTLDSSRVAVQD